MSALALEGFIEVSPLLTCGVYALAREGVVVYVGQSKKPLARIAAHRSNWGRKSTPAWMPASCRGLLFDQIFLRPCRAEDLNAVEAEMINLYKPRYNVRIKTPQPISAPFTIRVGDFVIPCNAARSTPPPFERRI
jgi:hypothetical protein